MPMLTGALAPQPANRTEIIMSFGWTYDLAAGTYPLFNVPAGYVVDELVTVVTQAFDATSPSATTGDGSDVDGYQDNTDIALNVAASATVPALKRSRNSGNPYANGKLYTEDDTVDVVWDPGTSGTTGIIKGWARLVPLIELGLSQTATVLLKT